MYLAFRGESVTIELDTCEVRHHIDIQECQYIIIMRDIIAPKQAIAHFDKRFKNKRHCSPNFANYDILKLRADFEAL